MILTLAGMDADGARSAGREALLRRGLRIAIVALAGTAALQVAYHLAVAPGMRIGAIVVETSLPLANAEVAAIAGVVVGDRFSSVRLDAIAGRLEALPEVARAVAERRFPDTLALLVEAREPVLALLASNERGSTVTFTVDGDGVVYRAGLPETPELPLLSGLAVDEVAIGSRLNSNLLRLVHDVARLKLQEPFLLSLVSQILVRPRSGAATTESFDATVYTVGYRVPLQFAESITASALSEGVLVLEALARNGELAGLQSVDMRGGPPVLVSALAATAPVTATTGASGG